MKMKKTRFKLHHLMYIAPLPLMISTISCVTKEEEVLDYEQIKNSIPNIYQFTTADQKYQYSLKFNLDNLPINDLNHEFKIDDFRVFDLEQKRFLAIDFNLSKIENKVITLKLKENFTQKKKSFGIRVKNNLIRPFILENIKSFELKNINQDKQYFFDLLKDMSTNEIPTIVEARNSSIVLQQAFLIALTNYFQNKSSSDYRKDMLILNIEKTAFSQGRVNEKVLQDNNISRGVDHINNFNEKNITNFNLIEGHNVFHSTSNFIKQYERIFSKFNINSKFDYYLDTERFGAWLNEFFENPRNSKLAYILKRCNRIIIGTEGASHTNAVVPNIIQKMRLLQLKEREVIIQKLKDYQEGKIDSLSTNDLLNLIVLKNFEATKENSNFDFITFINYDNNISNSIDIVDNMMWNEYPFSTNFVEYKNVIQNLENQKKFLNIFNQLFLNTEFSLENIFVNGLNQYDPKKRNVIFLGSSLFKPLNGIISPSNFSRLQKFPKLKEIVNNTMKKLLEKFPSNEFNIIFKLHPEFGIESDIKNEIGTNYVKLITNNVIENPIIINSKISIETFIASSYYQYEIKNNQKNILFRENEKYKPWEWTTFFGLQATTTSLHTTRIFYQSSFNLSSDEVANLIPFSNFPIPKEFPVVNRLDRDVPGNYYDANLEQIKKIYSYYDPSIMFNDLNLSIYDSIPLNF